LVIAGVTARKSDERKLIKIGVKDSKVLTPERRVKLAKEIEKIATNIIVLRVQPCHIDDCRKMGFNLDKIEAMKMAQIIDMSNGSKVFVDSLQQNPKKFENLIISYLQKKEADLVVRNYLDESVPIVSAASIIAKVERDAAIAELKKKVGFDFGIGYPSDARTIAFVKKLIKETKGELPTFVRKSWITVQLLKEQTWQKKIKDFFVKKD
jgi:ribonuclease HII